MKNIEQLVCMIPVRKGSARVPGKALRKICGRSLVEIAIERALTVFSSSSIYLNTDWDELKPISKNYGINFYRRSSSLCGPQSTNDEFMNDFLIRVPCIRVVQLLPTSPFLQDKDFVSFCKKSRELVGKKNSLISVGEHRIACVDQTGNPLNFNRTKQNPPSQEMFAILSYATVLMSWDSKTFRDSYKEHGFAYHGDINNYYHRMSHMSLMDIDTEDDYQEAVDLGSMLKSSFLKKNEF